MWFRVILTGVEEVILSPWYTQETRMLNFTGQAPFDFSHRELLALKKKTSKNSNILGLAAIVLEIFHNFDLVT